MSGVYKDFESFCQELHKCNECCKGDYLSIHCPLCPIWKYKPRQLSKVKQHLQVHWKAGVQGKNGLYSVICHLHHEGLDKPHYHCPTCGKIIRKKDNIKCHVKNCKNTVCASITQSPTVAGKTHTKQAAEESKRSCSVCGKKVNAHWMNAHLKQHEKEKKIINENRHHHSVLVSAKDGIFCSSLNLHGPSCPVHIIKKTGGDSLENFCDNLACIELKKTAVRGGNVTFECVHMQSTSFAVQGKQITMKDESLYQMKSSHFITEERYNEILKCKADSEGHPFVVQIPTKEEHSKRFIYLSIYTGSTRYWSKTGRTIVTFDTMENTFTCKCSPSKRYCSHKTVGKWYVYQELPMFFNSNLDSDEEGDNLESVDIDHTNVKQNTTTEFGKTDHQKTLDYLRTKRIPSDIPIELRAYKSSNPVEIRPKENKCHLCQGNLVEEVISKRAKIILTTCILKDVTVFSKICPRCRSVYRYQEWSEGLHNYNNIVFLGTDLCFFLRAGLMNHVALGRSIDMLEDILGEKLVAKEIMDGYLHFEVMTSHSYDFNCIRCGYYPSILIWDTFRKARFRYAVSELELPGDVQCEDTVDIEQFWGQIENNIIQQGMNSGLKKCKEEKLQPNFKKWSPWIGKNSRIGGRVYNTEYKKIQEHSSEELNEAMPEELLVHLLIDEKVTSIRKICKEAGVRSTGSAMDMILKLRQMSITRSSFDKAYEKVFGCSGGWAVGCCSHGVVYGIKNLLRSESPRDYVDLERSLKHRPNITICDIAHLVAAHANKIIPNFYSPNDGRLDEISDENISSAEEGNVYFSAPFLAEQVITEKEGDSNYNPTTDSEDHYALFDWFHQENCKKKSEVLRRCSLLKEINGLIDTQAVEQLFSSSKRDVYFLNNFSPANHLFIFRLLYHLRNQKINQKAHEKQTKTFGKNLTFNSVGQLIQKLEEQDEDIEQLNEYDRETMTELPENAIVIEEQEQPSDQLRLQIQVEEFSYVKEMIEAVHNSLSDLSPEEQSNFRYNIMYANRTLFNSATDDRQKEVRLVATQRGWFQHQGASNYCGLCCLNNAIGIPRDGPLITVKEMDDAADRLWMQMVDNPAYGLTSVRLEPMRDREGFYSFEVLQAVALSHGWQMIFLNAQSVLGMENEEVGIMVSNQLLSEYGKMILIIRLSNSEHWISIKEDNNSFLLFDSKKISSFIISTESLGSLIVANVRQPGACFFLIQESASHLNDTADVQQTTNKIQESASQLDDTADVQQTTNKIQESASQLDDTADVQQTTNKIQESASHLDDTENVQQTTNKIQESASQLDDTADVQQTTNKIQESASQLDDTADVQQTTNKIQESASQLDDTADVQQTTNNSASVLTQKEYRNDDLDTECSEAKDNEELPVPPEFLCHKDGQVNEKETLRSSEKEKYFLRQSPKKKRKRDSFIYPPQVKKSRVQSDEKEMCQNIPSDITDHEYTFHGKIFSGMNDGLPAEVVDLYLCLRCRECKDKKVYFLPSKVATSIFCSSDSDDCCPDHALLSAVDIESYDVLTGALHEGGCHWTLVVVLPVEGTIIYIDPRGETESVKHLYKQQWL